MGKAGVKGDTCTLDKNECIEEKPCVEANTVNCYNLWGSYTCICKDGFNGKNCQNRSPARLSTATISGDPTHAFAKTVSTGRTVKIALRRGAARRVSNREGGYSIFSNP